MRLAWDNLITLLLSSCHYYSPIFTLPNGIERGGTREGRRITKGGTTGRKEGRTVGWKANRIASSMNGELMNQSAAPVWALTEILNVNTDCESNQSSHIASQEDFQNNLFLPSPELSSAQSDEKDMRLLPSPAFGFCTGTKWLHPFLFSPLLWKWFD